jgi:hypothetical protein
MDVVALHAAEPVGGDGLPRGQVGAVQRHGLRRRVHGQLTHTGTGHGLVSMDSHALTRPFRLVGASWT